MNQITILLLCLIGLPVAGFFVYTSLERLMIRLDARAEIKTKLDELNQLGECSSCGRLSRKYQRDLVRYDLLFAGDVPEETAAPCPHCKKESKFLPISVSFPFHDTHLDCLPLQQKEYAEFKKQREQCEELLYLTKVNESFKNKMNHTERDC